MIDTPVVFLIFNRPDLTVRVFAEIRRNRPKKLFVVADGPRFDEEKEKVETTRAVVDKGVDWDCEVLKNYSAENMGCKYRVSSGLDWVFGQVAEAIILEDDCVPHPDLFRFCQELLDRYRYDKRIMMISGQSFWNPKISTSESYFFSRHVLIWGWATWRRAWKFNQLDMHKWPAISKTSWLDEVLESKDMAQKWMEIFDKTYKNEIDTWDYSWRFSLLVENGLVIVPYQNLVSNIGYGVAATHTKKTNVQLANYPISSISFPLRHPQSVQWNKMNDQLLQERIVSLSQPRPNLIMQLRKKLSSWKQIFYK